MPVLVDYIRDRFSNELGNVAVVSPDAGRIRVPSSGRNASVAARSLRAQDA